MLNGIPDPFDPLAAGGVGDPLGAPLSGGIPAPLGASGMAQDPAAAAAAEALKSPVSGAPLPDMLEPVDGSEKLLALGLAMIQADQAGLGLGGSVAAGMKAYGDLVRNRNRDIRAERSDRLAEYDLLARIRERQNTEASTARRMALIEQYRKTNPEMADLIDLDPEVAAKTIAERLKPKTAFEGTGMEAQTQNILLGGDPNTPEYLAAYNLAKQPKSVVGPDGAVQVITPDMSAYRVPVFNGGVPAADGTGAPKYGDKGGFSVGDPTLTNIEGLEIGEGSRPTPDDAKQVKAILEAKNNIGPLMEERQRLIDADPTPTAGSEAAMLLDQNTQQINLKLKALEQTGALDKGSVDVMSQAIGDPVIRGMDDFTSPVSSVAKSVTKARGGKALQDKMLLSGREYIDNTLKSAVSARGYKFKAPSDPAAPPAPPAADAPAATTARPAAAAPEPTAGALPTPKTQAEFDALPSGAHFINPADGLERIKE